MRIFEILLGGIGLCVGIAGLFALRHGIRFTRSYPCRRFDDLTEQPNHRIQ